MKETHLKWSGDQRASSYSLATHHQLQTPTEREYLHSEQEETYFTPPAGRIFPRLAMKSVNKKIPQLSQQETHQSEFSLSSNGLLFKETLSNFFISINLYSYLISELAYSLP